MRRPALSRRRARGFTLIELILVVAIMALLGVLAFPSFQVARQKALAAACGSNLRQIGAAVILSTGDNNGRFPEIEGMPNGPTYTYPQGTTGVQTMLSALSPYGVTTQVLKCPCDTPATGSNGQSYYVSQGTSYQWRPFLDDETSTAPVVVFRNNVITVSTTRMCLAFDFSPVHLGRMNRLYADGHVRVVTGTINWSH